MFLRKKKDIQVWNDCKYTMTELKMLVNYPFKANKKRHLHIFSLSQACKVTVITHAHITHLP